MKTLKATPTQKRIIKMLKENTGTHFLDSGGENGRMWQRNQNKEFLTSEHFTSDIYGVDNYTVSYNVFWFLSQHLTLSDNTKSLNAMFKHFAKRKENADNSDMQNMEAFCQYLFDKYEAEQIDRSHSFDAVNTYNFDNIISQTLQYVPFEYGNSQYLILQIHGGADVRGGYTAPYIFELTNSARQSSEAYYEFCDGMNRVTISDGENTWDSDNCGYNWYAANSEPDFKDIVICIDGKLYNKTNGKRLVFGNTWECEKGEGEIIPEIPMLKTFVQNNYTSPVLMDLVNAEFAEFTENSGLDLTPYVQDIIKRIESNTLEITF